MGKNKNLGLYLHQTHHSVGDFTDIFAYLENYFDGQNSPGLHLFPELFLTGYPLQDLCLQKPYIDAYGKLLTRVNHWYQERANRLKDTVLLMGGLKYSFDDNNLPLIIENVIYLLSKDSPLQSVYSKKLLPNYDIFDEKKYFTPGTISTILEIGEAKIALMICEDMWPSSQYGANPVEDIRKLCQQKAIDLDLIVNLSASPFHLKKQEKRLARAKEISQILKAPFAYVNRVGGEDEILFDGTSFVASGKRIISQAKSFCSDLLHLKWSDFQRSSDDNSEDQAVNIQAGEISNGVLKKNDNSWESLFAPQLNLEINSENSFPTLIPLGNGDCQTILDGLIFGIQEYAKKNSFDNFLVALSGGIDSALVLTITHLALGKNQSVEALFMPGFYSAPASYDLSYELCQNLKVALRSLPIKFFHSTIRNSFQDTFGQQMAGLTDENIQSRLRGSLLFARSNQTNAMVLNTSNKSELAVGYSTLYGDSVGAISVLGDLFKTEIYRLANYINEIFGPIIPTGIINRPPTAELREGQEDSDWLPPYDRLDAILEGILSYRMGTNELVQYGFSRQEVEKVYRLYQRSEYKRWQFCPIIKIKAKSFGFGYRVPISKK